MGEPKPATLGEIVLLIIVLSAFLSAALRRQDARLDAICAAVQCETPAPTGEQP